MDIYEHGLEFYRSTVYDYRKDACRLDIKQIVQIVFITSNYKHCSIFFILLNLICSKSIRDIMIFKLR